MEHKQMQTIQELAASSPATFQKPKVDWQGVSEAFRYAGVAAKDVLAATWCQIGHSNIGSNVDWVNLVVIHPSGVLATEGKKKRFGGTMIFEELDMAHIRSLRTIDHKDAGWGRFCIDLEGPGSLLIGRLQWTWANRRNDQSNVIALADERDRILTVLSKIVAS